MTRSIGLMKSGTRADYFREEQGILKCNACNASFQKPVLATMSSSGKVQKYYACPRCLTEVNNSEDRKNKEAAEKKGLINDVKKDTTESEEDVECKHYFGYL
ncbi:MAG: hypothetical protein GWO20_18275, partial [Candidatus Korarchaeota archaeon]|nr:hypothetical protein [Candidatus Korarchaeota archaeon]NIU85231.1 hypothetical protein [Candidatus Thorarchaeota archaeon]